MWRAGHGIVALLGDSLAGFRLALPAMPAQDVPEKPCCSFAAKSA